MSIKSLQRTGSCLFVIALLALASWPRPAATQDDSAGAAPPNAQMKRYGGGWECDRGYQNATEVSGKPMRYARRSKCPRTPSWVPAEADGSAIEGTEGSTIPAWRLRYPRTPISTLPESAGSADEDSTIAAIRARPSRFLRKDTSGVRATIGNAIAVTGGATSHVSRSRFPRTATSTRRGATGTASEASRRDSTHVWPSRCRSTLTSVTRATAGVAIRATCSRERLASRTRDRGAGAPPGGRALGA
jgi:hypothetical protein